MLVDVSKIEITNDILERGRRWHYNNVSLKKAIKEDKYLVLNWDYIDYKEFKKVLPSLDKDIISGYLFDYNIDNKELIFSMLEYIETENEEYLCNSLVDSRTISNAVYLDNNYRDNFELWYKFCYSKEMDSLLPVRTINISNEEIVHRMDVLHISKKQQQAINRRNIVFEWLDSIIDFDYDDIVISNTDYRHLDFKFKSGVKCLQFGISNSILEKIPEDKRSNFFIDLKGKKALIFDVSDSTIDYPFFSNEMSDLINSNNNLPKKHIMDYVSKWFKDKQPDWKEIISRKITN